ncbi:MAG: hypothetical protein ABFS41_14035, partial [Myxococcota bacterium]
MCGIAGFSGNFDALLLERMNAAQAHRGPDDAGTLFVPETRIGLAHRRLSIIDLSPRGRQPMWDVQRRAAIVYNGELYNYRELRRELVADGFAFQSECDTEVLLNLYLRDGEKMLERLNGIFSFAIWDARTRSMLVARDGVGVKPLYYAETPRGFLFASELKALLQEPSIDRSLDPEAVRHHILFLWCPSPITMLRSVRKLEPGNALVVKDGRVTRHFRFYDPRFEEEYVDWPEGDAVVQVGILGVGAVTQAQQVSEVDQLVSNGWENYRNGLFKEAVLDFKRALRMDGENVGAAEGLGAAAYQLQDWPKAKLGYESAHELAPENCGFSKSLAYV